MEFCNRTTSILPALQGSENQNEHFTSNFNAESFTSIPMVHPDTYTSLISNEPSSSTPCVDISGRQSYHQNELPVDEYEEYDDEEDEEDK